ncbi:RNA methyltransferase [Gangjinia marincola]|uniref:RNA methyltransferase n=1 Tax=Gangjinia marincola TaxID=578463 RepID=A0ABN1MJ93_9FLAO
MVSKSQIKLILSLSQKKYRNKHGLFVAEGIKVINELINSSFKLSLLLTAEGFFEEISTRIIITDRELKSISNLSTPQKALAIFEIPQASAIKVDTLVVALDGVRDPGNLGTIIRLCDWFGVKQLLCSHDTVDAYNPKVIQATMGSIARVEVHYLDLKAFVINSSIPVYGTFMDGVAVQHEELSSPAVLVLGNEANGISNEVEDAVTSRISISPYGKNPQTESLNVATAAAIFLHEFRRG